MLKLLMLAAGLVCVLAFGWWLYGRNQNEVGRDEWARVKAELEAKGEKLGWVDFAPAPVPDAENFMETPFLVGVAYREFSETALLRRLNSRPVGDLTILFRGPDEPAALDWPAISGRLQTNLALGQVFRSTNGPGRILEWLEPQAADFNELRAAAHRPYSQFRFDATNGVESLIPNFVAARTLAQRYAVSAGANAAAGNSQEALDDLRVNLALARAFESEPTLVGFMIGTAIHGLTIGVVHQALSTQVWDDRQLAELEAMLRRINLPAGLAPAFRRERAGINWHFEHDPSGLSSPFSQYNLPPALSRLARRLQPEGWSWRARAVYNRTLQEFIIEPFEAAAVSGRRPEEEPVKELERRAEGTRHPRFSMAMAMTPNFIRAGTTVYKHQTWINQARLAIAIERFRLQHGRLPDALSALLPAHLDVLPSDIINGESLRYRKLTDEDFLLWSVGWNEVDEDGKVGEAPDASDWVWIGF